MMIILSLSKLQQLNNLLIYRTYVPSIVRTVRACHDKGRVCIFPPLFYSMKRNKKGRGKRRGRGQRKKGKKAKKAGEKGRETLSYGHRRTVRTYGVI